MRTLLALLVLTHAALADLPPEIAKAQWRVRDVAADSAWLDASTATKVGLKRDEKGDTCTVTDTTERDRLVTLAFCVPISGESWTWWDDPQRHRPANGDKPLCNVTDNAGGLNNQASFYPLAVMSTADRAVCLAVPPSVPRMVRFI